MSTTAANSDDATVRELIVQLAQVEDAMRQAPDGDPDADDLAEREQAIVAALHRHGLPFHAQSAETP